MGREEIGLYTSGNARGFSPSQAGNLRIDGLYFDQVSQLASRVARSSSVHVGIAAQGFPFPAPTGVVDFHLRTPGERSAGGGLLGIASYEQSYVELDYQTAVIDRVLSVGGGFGYTRNPYDKWSERSEEWSLGGIAAWQPAEALKVTPFWSTSKHLEYEERAYVFIGDSGYPKYRNGDRRGQRWANWTSASDNFGATAQLDLGNRWRIDAGLFRSQTRTDFNYEPLLLNTDGAGEGDYSVSAAPPRTNRSTSGELRVSKQVLTQDVRNTLYFSVRGRDRRGETGGTHNVPVGRALLSALPVVPKPDFTPGRTTLVEAEQVTSGIGYDGVWRNVGQLSAGVQKSFYARTITAPDSPSQSGRSEPWLYNVGAAAYLTRKLVAYASYARGFEEIGNAPMNAANRDETAPAQITEQADAGVKFQVLPGLTFIAGAFDIEKPYFNLDGSNMYRRVGVTRNRGAEFSLAGNVTERFTVVAGVILIDPTVSLDASEGGATRVAVGPAPKLIRANLQYRPPFMENLRVEAKIESTSSRWARYRSVRLPALTTLDLGGRYRTQLFGRDATLRLQLLNVTNEYGLTPAASGQLTTLESRRFDLSLAFDI